MPALQFLPWCHLADECCAGDVTLLPFTRDSKIKGSDALHTAWARLILNPYKNSGGLPVRQAVLVRYGDKDLFADVSDDERARTSECVDLTAFAALSKREFFIPWRRNCNFDNFRMVGHRFPDDPAWAAIVTRRPEGETWNMVALAEVVFSQPLHVNSKSAIDIDRPLLEAILKQRSEGDQDEWRRWQNAIICFNRANTDDSAMLHQVEWTLLCSAFQHLLDANSKAKDVARLFAEATPQADKVLATASRRKPERREKVDKSLRYEWLREFYRIRGDFAHGRLTTRQPTAWNLGEHLLLAKMVFPLLVRCLLAKAGRYQLVPTDCAQLRAFEPFADCESFKPDELSDDEPPWQKCLEAELQQAHLERVIAGLGESSQSGDSKNAS